jgi:hypothetical protein
MSNAALGWFASRRIWCLGQDQLDPLVGALRGRLLQALPRGIDLALLGEHLGVADLRLDVLLALAHISVPFQRARQVLAVLRDLAQIEAHSVLVAVGRAEKALEILLRGVVILELQRKQRHRERHVGAVRQGGHQLLELGAGFGEALLRHQGARVGEPCFTRRRILLTKSPSSAEAWSIEVL